MLTDIEVITLFVDDLAAAVEFYRSVFRTEAVYEDDASCVLQFGSLMVNLLQDDNAPELVEPTRVAAAGSGSRFLLTIRVPDVDAACAELSARGAQLLNGPVDRAWGRRTAAFADPAGHVWEVAAEIAQG